MNWTIALIALNMLVTIPMCTKMLYTGENYHGPMSEFATTGAWIGLGGGITSVAMLLYALYSERKGKEQPAKKLFEDM